MDAKTIRCPSCGAPSTQHGKNCQHCGSVLATVVCPKCLNLMFRDEQFCSTCGGAPIEWITKPGQQNCPECEQPMLRGNLGSCSVDHCGQCHGLWLDKAVFTQICSDSEAQSSVITQTQLLGQPSVPQSDRIRYRPCPVCRQRMNRVNFARCSGVVVDVCSSHGTWFDHHELQSIVRFIRSGGLQKSRELEKSQLESERKKLELERRYPAASQPTYYGSATGGLEGDMLVGALRIICWVIRSFVDRR